MNTILAVTLIVGQFVVLALFLAGLVGLVWLIAYDLLQERKARSAAAEPAAETPVQPDLRPVASDTGSLVA